MGRLITAILICSLSLCARAQQVPSAPTEFIVLRTDRVDVPADETIHLNCSVVGSGDAAQISCESETSGGQSETPADPYGKLAGALHAKLGTKVYHLALVVGSNHVGYVVSCVRSSSLLRTRCYPLSTGQVLKGSVHGDKLSVGVGSKTRNYTVETSAYVGPHTASLPESDSTASPSVEQPGAEPTVKLAVEKSSNPASPPRSSQTPPGDFASVTSPLGVSGTAFLAHCETEGDKAATEACKLWVDGFLNGLVAGMVAATPGEAEFDLRRNDVVCFTDTATYGQVFPLILKYIKDHPREADDPTAALALTALQQEFPCKQ